MRGSPVLVSLLVVAVLVGAAVGLSCDVSGCCSLPPRDGGYNTTNVCDSGSFTACVRSCGESDATESTAATCSAGVYSCDNSTIPAVSCPSSGWSAALACGPWVSGHDCGLQCGVCIKGLWTCAPCPDAATD
jgi:hypothetical protein